MYFNNVKDVLIIPQVRYKKLKENVSKIKSHLPVDDISNFRDLDHQGKLHVTGCSGVNLGSALKIAAAARRLNLGAGMKRRSRMRSALPKISVQGESRSDSLGLLDMRSKSVVSINDPPVVDRIKRSNSITGAFIDAPDVNGDDQGANKLRPASAFLPHNRRLVSRPQTVNGPPSSNPRTSNTVNNTNLNSDHSSNTNNDIKITGNGFANNIISSADSISSLAIPADTPRGAINEIKKDSLKPANGFIPISVLNQPNKIYSELSSVEETGPEQMPTFRSTSSILHRPRSPFSSHSQSPRRASAPARHNRRLSHISTDSIDR